MVNFNRLSSAHARTNLIVRIGTNEDITMKRLYIFKTLLISLLTLSATSVFAGHERVFTEQGYPYKQLVKRSDTVKLIYSQDGQQVTCKVAIEHKGLARITTEQTISAAKFADKPLANCLKRDTAKSLLAMTFRG